MRKAFETNVPRLKPRLRPTSAAEQTELAPAALAPDSAAVDPVPAAEAPPAAVPEAARARRVETSPLLSETVASPASQGRDVTVRRERLLKIKRKVAEAARPVPRLDPAPTDPARAAESVLSLVGELEGEVSRSREREEALRTDLDSARAELSRAAAEARGTAEQLLAAERELAEKRGVLSELLSEMEALEQERDEAVRRAQALSSLDEERARILEEVTRRAEEETKARADREAEVERLAEELRTSAADGARLRTAVGELARERDQLALELDRVRAERDELLTAKRALEQVHAALAQARARLT